MVDLRRNLRSNSSSSTANRLAVPSQTLILGHSSLCRRVTPAGFRKDLCNHSRLVLTRTYRQRCSLRRPASTSSAVFPPCSNSRLHRCQTSSPTASSHSRPATLNSSPCRLSRRASDSHHSSSSKQLLRYHQCRNRLQRPHPSCLRRQDRHRPFGLVSSLQRRSWSHNQPGGGRTCRKLVSRAPRA